tara:strand:+ start:152 stop:514 length:363 start_codon:yes stop_codon:yes gene_type:complete
MEGLIIMNDLIKTLLTGIQNALKDSLDGIVVHCRITKKGNIQCYLNDFVDSDVQETLSSALSDLDDNLTCHYRDNLKNGEPIKYLDEESQELREKTPDIIICPVSEPKSIDDMFASLDKE